MFDRRAPSVGESQLGTAETVELDDVQRPVGGLEHRDGRDADAEGRRLPREIAVFGELGVEAEAATCAGEQIRVGPVVEGAGHPRRDDGEERVVEERGPRAIHDPQAALELELRAVDRLDAEVDLLEPEVLLECGDGEVEERGAAGLQVARGRVIGDLDCDELGLLHGILRGLVHRGQSLRLGVVDRPGLAQARAEVAETRPVRITSGEPEEGEGDAESALLHLLYLFLLTTGVRPARSRGHTENQISQERLHTPGGA